MRKYDSYKDSGIEWIGEIPSHWEVKKGKRFIPLKNGFPFDSSKFSPFSDSGLPLVRIRDIESNAPQTFYKGEVVEDAIIDNGDILIGMDGDFNIAIWNGGKALLNQRVCKVEKDEKFDGKFLFYLFPKYLKVINDLTYYTTVKHLSNNDLWKVKYPLPPKSEQTAIAAYLDRKTAEIDELIADKKRLLELYEEEKTAIINQAVTKGINPNVPLKDSGIEWLGEIPEHWETVSLKWVSKIYSGGTPSKNNEDFWQNGTIPWLNSGTVNQFFITEPSEFITEEALNSSSAKWIPEHSIVIALAGQGKTKGMAAQVMFECTCNQSMGVIVPNDIIVNRFLLYYLTRNYQNIRNLGGGDKRDGINLEMVGGIPLPVIPLPEQAEIVRHIEDHSNLIDAKKAKTEKLIELLTEYRTALISEVVTGKIKVTD